MKKYVFFLMLVFLIIIWLGWLLVNNNLNKQVFKLQNNSVFKVVIYTKEKEPPSSEGTAFAIGDNTIITNYHVIKYPQKILLYNLEGDEFHAKLKSYDVKTDLAILELSENYKTDVLLLSDSNIQINDIVSVANKGNIEKGFIKGISKTIPRYNESVLKYFEIKNIQVENGSSGSPVFNEKGEVVGIVSAKATINNELIAYAIPISDVKGVIDSIKRGTLYHHNILGIEATELSNNNENFPGLLVNNVHDNKSDHTMIQVGDVIKRFDEKEVANINDLRYEVFQAISNQRHNIEIIRGAQYLKLSVKLNQDQE